MMIRLLRTELFRITLLGLLFSWSAVAWADVETAPRPRPAIKLVGFRTVETAIPADPKLARAASTASSDTVTPGFLGIELIQDEAGLIRVEAVAPESPAEAAGLEEGDQILQIDDEVVSNLSRLKDQLRGVAADTAVQLQIKRNDALQTITITARPLSRPLSLQSARAPTTPRVLLGVQSRMSDDGLTVTAVTSGSSAEKAGLKSGDLILQVDEQELDAENSLRDLLMDKSPGDVVRIQLKRGDEEMEVRATLSANPQAQAGRRQQSLGWDDRLPRAWTRPDYKLAVIGVEFPDTKRNDKVKDADWEESLFSIGSYNDRNATGQRAFGSMNDYFQEISYGKFSVSGKFVGWVEVSKKRAEYGVGTSKAPLLNEIMELATKEFGRNTFNDYDGIFILYAGGMATSNRGNVYWPHRATLTYQGKRWPYFIVNEMARNNQMRDISVFCHEFGHMLGLPDLYARPENPGSEGVWQWCAMSNQLGSGRPQHFSAWCKDQLGWIKPVVIDPRIKQKLVLSPIETDPSQCFKVLVRPDGSEYFLLENRRKIGYDTNLPGQGLLVWRVVRGGKPVLEESHGIEGPQGPRSFTTSVPFPSRSNDSFTPYTTPSSKSQLGGGFDVHITNIRELPDGRITFHMGYEYH